MNYKRELKFLKDLKFSDDETLRYYFTRFYNTAINYANAQKRIQECNARTDPGRIMAGEAAKTASFVNLGDLARIATEINREINKEELPINKQDLIGLAELVTKS